MTVQDRAGSLALQVRPLSEYSALWSPSPFSLEHSNSTTHILPPAANSLSNSPCDSSRYFPRTPIQVQSSDRLRLSPLTSPFLVFLPSLWLNPAPGPSLDNDASLACPTLPPPTHVQFITLFFLSPDPTIIPPTYISFSQLNQTSSTCPLLLSPSFLLPPPLSQPPILYALFSMDSLRIHDRCRHTVSPAIRHTFPAFSSQSHLSQRHSRSSRFPMSITHIHAYLIQKLAHCPPHDSLSPSHLFLAQIRSFPSTAVPRLFNDYQNLHMSLSCIRGPWLSTSFRVSSICSNANSSPAFRMHK